MLKANNVNSSGQSGVKYQLLSETFSMLEDISEGLCPYCSVPRIQRLCLLHLHSMSLLRTTLLCDNSTGTFVMPSRMWISL